MSQTSRRPPAGEGPIDGRDRAARLLSLASADAPDDLDEPTRARLRARIRGTLALRDRHQPALRLRLAAVVILALLGGGAVGASIQSAITRRAARRADAPSDAPRPAPRPRGAAPAPANFPPDDALFPPDPMPGPAIAADERPEAPATEAPSERPTSRRAAPVTARAAPLALAGPPAPPAAPGGGAAPEASRADGDATESVLLAEAIRKLRADGDPAAALALLDQNAARLRAGPLAVEATVLRIEALLRQKQAPAALAALEGLPIDAVPRRTEWHVIRGELRAAAGDATRAEIDFTAVLAPRAGAADELAERALWGRAAARTRRGDVVGARADFAAYLLRFPAGPHAASARAAVTSLQR